MGDTEVCRWDTGFCEDVCEGRDCGVVDGIYCGDCEGLTEVCRLSTGLCEDVCMDRECGTVEGIFCGECEGSAEVCREETGVCDDVCLWRECGVVDGIDCGTCLGDDICVNYQCFTPVCPGGMCQVPAGTFWMGCNEEVDLFCDGDEHPYHEVYLDAFEIGMFEVTQAEYFVCMIDGDCTVPRMNFDPETHGDEPVIYIEWDQAKTFCEWAGKRLCTEAEWEKAARGNDGRRYPWGNEPATCEYAVMDDGGDGCDTGTMMSVGSKPAGASPFGAQDMAGNVWEYVYDYYSETYYSECVNDCTNPQGPTSGIGLDNPHVWRGGDYQSWAERLRTSERDSPFGPNTYIGFRCCR